MKSLIHTFLKGVLYVLILPLLLVGLCFYIIIALFAMIIVSIIAFIKACKGQNIFKELPEDIEAKKRLEEMAEPGPQLPVPDIKEENKSTIINVYQNINQVSGPTPIPVDVNNFTFDSNASSPIETEVKSLQEENLNPIPEEEIPTPVISGYEPEPEPEDDENYIETDDHNVTETSPDLRKSTYEFELEEETPSRNLEPESSIPVIHDEDEEFFVEEISDDEINSGVKAEYDEGKNESN